MRSFLPSVALVTAAFLFGCQDMGSGPVGLDGLGPEFAPKKCIADPTLSGCGGGGDDGAGGTVALFLSPTFSCVDGAVPVGSSKGTVSWENVRRQDGHIHATVQLTGVPDGGYLIFGNQDVLCKLTTPFVDFALRPLHATSITVVGGSGEARIGLTFGAEDDQGDPLIPAGHAQGPHRLWLTITGTGGVFRSSAFEVVIKKHKGDH